MLHRLDPKYLQEQQQRTDREEPRNTLRMGAQSLERLRSDLGTRQSRGDQSRRRVFMRWPFPQGGVEIEMHHPGGTSKTLRYACRDLSGGGMSILHGAYIYVGTRCTVTLPHPVDGTRAVKGKVVRCEHYRDKIHEIGIRFNAPIDVREFLSLDPFAGAFALEHVDPNELSGSLLHVEDSPTDRRLVRHHLRDTSLTIVGVETAGEAISRAKEGWDVILSDFDMPDTDGIQLTSQLRAAGVVTPIILVSSDTRHALRAQAREAGANAFCTKPVTREQLLRAIAEFLILGGLNGEGGGPIYSTLKPDDASANFIPDFVEELHRFSTALQKSLADDDAGAARRLCSQIKGAAPALGFEPIAVLAESAHTAITASMSVTESSRAVKSLISACARARTRDPR